ncbi:microtubule associated protein-domain-containing protein [Mucidula mucida]|nr:microtubule associated protein-domain-containing protein [Mucidula mucida]
MASLTALLNSLHSHLQAQTHLLPPLHAQLGLPASALEDELATIQQNLMDSVEAQIESRRKEVEMWMEKCEAVEHNCILYQKSLGGHIKSTGNSVGELRKEKVLPHRFNLASDHQEKLRQLYHTKLEQLTTLSNRLHALARILGHEFFTPDVLDDDLDTSVHRDVTPERFVRMEKELVRGKAEVSKRLQQLSATFVQIDWLYTELGMTPPSLDDLPSSIFCTPSFLSSSSTSGSRMDPFTTSTPTPASRNQSLIIHREDVLESDCRRIFANFVAKVEEAEDEGLCERNGIPIGLEHVDPTPSLLKWAANLQASLEDTKRRRETHIQAMYDELEGLWKRLGVDEGDMDAFVDAHRGSTDETVKEYEDELERMLELKRERMSVFVANAREEIVKLWDELMIGDEERADFAPFADDEHTEELLTIHEDEIKKLKEEKRMKAPLLAAIKKYFEISEEEKELAASAADQSRLTGRGARDPGRLLREEKMRKRVTKEKPRLEQDLLASLPVWEQEAGRPFLVYGESMLQALMTTLSAADQENKRKPRSGSVPPRSTTPVSHSYAPTKSGVVTPAVRPAGSSVHSAPNKRMRLNESTDRAPLGMSRSHNGRAVSPSKIPGSGSTRNVTSSLPRPIAMPIPKPGTQHHALGHGRMPSSGVMHGSVNGYAASGIRSASALGYIGGRVVSGGALVAKKASRARRESFKPRPSIDADVNLGASTRWAGFAASVREEDEYC